MYEIILRKQVTRIVSGEKSYERLADTGGDDTNKPDGGPKFGYVTKPDYEKTEWIEVLKQQAEDCSVLEVVAAFNGVTFK